MRSGSGLAGRGPLRRCWVAGRREEVGGAKAPADGGGALRRDGRGRWRTWAAARLRARTGPGWAPRAAAVLEERERAVVDNVSGWDLPAAAVGHVRARRENVRRRRREMARVSSANFLGRGTYL